MIGMIAALVLLFPAALPILGRVISWVVGKLPSLAGWAGVVSVKAFDGVVKAIERASRVEASPAGTSQMANAAGEQNGLSGSLRGNLSRALDAEHKALVKSRKGALGL
jgi:hypothetical protein